MGLSARNRSISATPFRNTLSFMLDLSFDSLDPIGKRAALSAETPVFARAADQALLVLAAVDSYLSVNFHYDGIYLLDKPDLWQSLSSLQAVMDRETWEKSLVALQLCQLVYRFTVARKFLLTDPSIKQLRINSWGREVARDCAGMHQDFWRGACDDVERALAPHSWALRAIVDLARMPVTSEGASQFKAMNSSLPFGLVQ